MIFTKLAKGSTRSFSLPYRCTAFALSLLLLFSSYPGFALGSEVDSAQNAQSHSLSSVDRGLQRQEPQFYQETYPSKYFLTNLGFVTPAKLQSPWGDCWAFAIASALESSILKASSELTSNIEDYSINAIENENAVPDVLDKQLGISSTETDLSVHMFPTLQDLPESIDLSERAIAWFSHEVQTEASAGGQAGEGYSLADPNNNYDQLAAGNFEMIESQLFAGQGIIAETIAPYRYNNYDPDLAKSGNAPLWYSIGKYTGAPNDARTKDWSLDASIRGDISIDWRVDETFKLPSPAMRESTGVLGQQNYIGYDTKGTDSIKGALMSVGSVAISLCMDANLPGDVVARASSVEPSDHFSYTNWCQYDASNTVTPDHAVAIVGWDDSYPASNFSGTVSGMPPHDGAWLCKNNWGSDNLYKTEGRAEDMTHWGLPDSDGAASGFFWLSYYDHTIGDPTVFTVEPVSESISSVYQYDYLGASEFRSPNAYKSEVWVANTFIANKTELLESVSAQTFDEDQSVQIEIYTLPVGTNITESEANSLMRSSSCVYKNYLTFSNAGLHKVELSKPVLIEKNQPFIVAESVSGTQIDSEGVPYDATFLSLEMAYIDSANNNENLVFATTVANPGETFVTLNAEGTSNADRLWYSLDDFEDLYNEQVASNGTGRAANFGNALIKAYSKLTTMEQTGQIYQTVELTK